MCESFGRGTALSWRAWGFLRVSNGNPACWEAPPCGAHWRSWLPCPWGFSLCQPSKPSLHFSLLFKSWGNFLPAIWLLWAGLEI